MGRDADDCDAALPRHSAKSSDQTGLQRSFNRLGDAFPIPNEAEEKADPVGADIKIAAAISEVRERAKLQGIKAVHRENINFGAARNAYGLKPWGSP